MSSMILKIDPTRTVTLRRMFTARIKKRFELLKKEIQVAVEEKDFFGLRPNLQHPMEGVSPPGLTENAFSFKDFVGAAGKLNQFMSWLGTKVKQTIFSEATLDQPQRAWWFQTTKEAFDKGQQRAFVDFNKGKLAEIGDAQKAALQAILGQPDAPEPVKILASRVYTELKGVTEAMSQRMARVLSDGLAQGKSPKQIADILSQEVEGISKQRAEMIANTEIVRAHAEGQLNQLEKMGVAEAGVKVEWVVAKKGVCPLCAANAGKIYTVQEAHGLIPVHPNCRCTFVPITKY